MTAFYATAEYGTAETPRSGLGLACGPASYVVSGKAAHIARAVSAAAFSLAGVAALGIAAMACAPAALAWSGNAVAAPIAAPMASAPFLVSSKAAAMAMANGPAAFVLAGQTVQLGTGQACSKASFTLAGFAVQGAILTPPASFALQGQAAGGSGNTVLLPAGFALFGKPVFRSWTIGFGIPGEPATAEYGTAEFPRRQIYQAAARAAAFAWSGRAALLTAAPESLAFVLSGGTADLAIGVDAAAFALVGQGALTQLRQASAAAAFVVTPKALQSLLPLDPTAFQWAGADVLLRPSLFAGRFALAGIDAFNVKWLGVGAASFNFSGAGALVNVSIAVSRAAYNLLGWSLADVIGPSGDYIYLIEAQAHDGTALRTFYLATEGFTSQPSDTPANQYYDPRIIDPGNFERALFDGTSLRGRGRSGSGDIIVASADPGNGEVLDAWLNYGWSQREIRIRSLPRGAKSLAAASTLFVGKLANVSSTKPLDQLSLKIGDRLADLQQPLLTTLYAGTTLASAPTAEGNGDLKGKIKQRCWGVCANVPLQPVNPYDQIYLASNSAVVSIAVFDGGGALVNDGDDAGIAALRSASIPGGHYRTCLALGLVRVGAMAAKTLTADVVEGANAASHSAGQIAYRMLLAFGVPSLAISTGSIAALDLRNASPCGYFVDDDREALGAVQDVLDSIGAWMAPDRDGTLVFGRFEAPTAAPQSTYQLDAVSIGDSLERVDNDLPVWRVLVEYGPSFTVQGDADLLGGAVTDARRSFVATGVRTATPAEAPAVKTKHLAATELTIKTFLVNASDAAAEGVRQLAMLSAERQRYNVTMPLADGWPNVPGSAITLVNPRLGLAGGKPFAVLQRVDRYQDHLVEFSLWG